MSHFSHVDGGAIDGFDRQVVQLFNGLRGAVEFHLILDGAHFDGARGQQEILCIDGVDDVRGRKTFGLQSLRVQVDGDKP